MSRPDSDTRPTVITGGAGFIGSHLTERLLESGRKVIGFDSIDGDYDPQMKRSRLAKFLPNNNYRFVEGDIRNGELLRRLFADEDVGMVYHLAAKVGVRESLEAPDLYFDVNVNGTQTLLDAMVAARVPRLLFTSSSSVYGSNTTLPFSESGPPAPISPYGRTKVRGEELCAEYRKQYALDARVVRLFTFYGPSSRPDMAISRFIQAALCGEAINLFGDGSLRRDFTWVGDGVEGIVLVSSVAEAPPVVNIGSGSSVTLNELVAVIAEATGFEPTINILPKHSLDVEATEANLTIARSIGYEPHVQLRQGIRRCIEELCTQSRKGRQR
ncbi:MAG: NAD-dependent epimerase/dehydratase family protein [Ignavibacteriae bacterium]|nr:NAD-dependent epimerase/dehydratase family protein [Ignavibacteriota bacterium]MCB9217315.1 NAD-dependent epimerase/dehydratase family protein [Ignavibacteria bacterium]